LAASSQESVARLNSAAERALAIATSALAAAIASDMRTK
jgi:hypothetical protein